ncbi:hypothetical protein [Nocardia harenae]|uniref:hypothetical protein n=1 Tax=Nocardia harenae TaxID=358707 RepID=UPI00082C3864|nr:hypothetical protein [Nocardia harenae]
MLHADIEQIRILAGKLGEAGDRIDGVDVRTSADALGSALPDQSAPSVLAQALGQAAEFVEGAYLRAADRYRQVGTACVVCADRAETTEEEFAGRLAALDVHRA